MADYHLRRGDCFTHGGSIFRVTRVTDSAAYAVPATSREVKIVSPITGDTKAAFKVKTQATPFADTIAAELIVPDPQQQPADALNERAIAITPTLGMVLQ
jgi:hypothetical protein